MMRSYIGVTVIASQVLVEVRVVGMVVATIVIVFMMIGQYCDSTVQLNMELYSVA